MHSDCFLNPPTEQAFARFDAFSVVLHAERIHQFRRRVHQRGRFQTMTRIV